MKPSLLALALLAALCSPAFAATPTSDERIEELEARIKVLEAGAAAPVESSGAAVAGVNGNAFNPAISMILNGQYAHHSLNPEDYLRAGFPLAGEAGPGVQGLSIGESEISLSANVDEKFYGQLTLAASSENGSDAVDIEEAFVDTTALPTGLTLRAGRFFSDIGYLNSHHAHTDKFSDRPLAYQAFLGAQYGDDGLQLRWVAPTEMFVELGSEVFRGERFPAGGAAHDGAGVYTLFAHAGGDVGVESSWLAGVSMLHAKTVGGEDGFSGNTKLYVADVTWKWASQGNTRDGGILVRSEFFLDDRDGRYAEPDDPELDQPWTGKRRGMYIEGVYRINRTWETGYRYDQLWSDNSGPFASSFDPHRHSVMLTWRNSEFSLVRLQLSRDFPDAAAVDNAITLQIQTALGAHGAHKF